MLIVKESFNLEDLKDLGFEKARDYYHNGNISVRICDREVLISYCAKASRNPQSLRIAINPILLKMAKLEILEEGK